MDVVVSCDCWNANTVAVFATASALLSEVAFQSRCTPSSLGFGVQYSTLHKF